MSEDPAEAFWFKPPKELLIGRFYRTFKVALQLKMARSWKLTSGVDGPVLEGSRVRPDAKLPRVLHQNPVSQTLWGLRPSGSSYRVHLSQHGPVAEELRLPGVHHDQVEAGAPGLVLRRQREKEGGLSSSSAGRRTEASHLVVFQQVSHDGLREGQKQQLS